MVKAIKFLQTPDSSAINPEKSDEKSVAMLQSDSIEIKKEEKKKNKCK